MSTVGVKRERVYCPLGQVRAPRQDVSFEAEEQKGLRLTSSFVRTALLGVLAFCFIQSLSAQELAPRAYIITPVHSNAITLSWSFYDGAVDFNGGLSPLLKQWIPQPRTLHPSPDARFAVTRPQ